MKLPIEFIKLITTKKIFIFLVLILIAGILIITYGNKSDKTVPVVQSSLHDTYGISDNNVSNYDEIKLKDVLSKVEGVGEVEIIISYSQNNKSDSEKNNSGKHLFKSDTTVETGKTNKRINGDNEDIVGVIIVAGGGGDDSVISCLRSAVSGYLGIPAHKVNILKMK